MTTGIGGMDPGALQRKAMEAMQKVGSETGTSGGGPAEAGASDLARFQAAMQPPAEETPPALPGTVTNAPSAPGIVPTGAPTSAPTMGERILQGLNSASEKIQTERNTAAEIMNKENVNQADLLRANFALLESGALVSAIAKSTEKVTQGIKTLQQG